MSRAWEAALAARSRAAVAPPATFSIRPCVPAPTLLPAARACCHHHRGHFPRPGRGLCSDTLAFRLGEHAGLIPPRSEEPDDVGAAEGHRRLRHDAVAGDHAHERPGDLSPHHGAADHGRDLEHALLEVGRRTTGQRQPVHHERLVLGEDDGIGSRDGDPKQGNQRRHTGGQRDGRVRGGDFARQAGGEGRSKPGQEPRGRQTSISRERVEDGVTDLGDSVRRLGIDPRRGVGVDGRGPGRCGSAVLAKEQGQPSSCPGGCHSLKPLDLRAAQRRGCVEGEDHEVGPAGDGKSGARLAERDEREAPALRRIPVGPRAEELLDPPERTDLTDADDGRAALRFVTDRVHVHFADRLPDRSEVAPLRPAHGSSSHWRGHRQRCTRCDTDQGLRLRRPRAHPIGKAPRPAGPRGLSVASRKPDPVVGDHPSRAARCRAAHAAGTRESRASNPQTLPYLALHRAGLAEPACHQDRW